MNAFCKIDNMCSSVEYSQFYPLTVDGDSCYRG